MATVSVTTDLDVLGKYNKLIDESLDGNSIYVRSKETLEELLQDGGLTSSDKASVISSVLGGLNSSVVTSAMSTALNWVAQEKDLAMRKLELEVQLDILEQDKLLREAQVDKAEAESIATQASNIRANGVATVVDGKVASLDQTGLQYINTEIAKEKLVMAPQETALMTSRVKEANAGINKIVADTYTNYGQFGGYTITDSGVTGVTDTTPVGHKTITKSQLDIASEQAKGYTYNAWANAASSSASMIGVLLSTDTTFDPSYLTAWSTSVTNLNNITPPSI